MTSNLVHTPTPEERELAAKQTELEALETQLAQRELDCATLRLELVTFERRYLRVVGVKFVEMDELEAQIAEAMSRRNPSDDTARAQADGARAYAAESAAATGAVVGPVLAFTPSDDLKRLYRDVAKRVHPDLATDAAERAKRTQVMAEVNRAYEDGDEARLRAILSDWESSPDAVTGDGIGAELIRMIRKLHQVQARMTALDAEIAALRASEIATLKRKADEAQVMAVDLLAQMADDFDERIGELRVRRDAAVSADGGR